MVLELLSKKDKQYLPRDVVMQLAEQDIKKTSDYYKKHKMISFPSFQKIDGNAMFWELKKMDSERKARDLFDLYSKIKQGQPYYTKGIITHRTSDGMDYNSPTLNIAVKHSNAVYVPSNNQVFYFLNKDLLPRMTVIDPSFHIWTVPEDQKAYVEINSSDTIKMETQTLRTPADNRKNNKTIKRLLEETLEGCDIVEVRNHSELIPTKEPSFEMYAEDKNELYNLVMEFFQHYVTVSTDFTPSIVHRIFRTLS